MNTFLRKNPNRRWTWISPNRETKNEIDFIVIDKLQTAIEVPVLNGSNTRSNHRLVHSSFSIKTKLERTYLVSQRKTPNHQILSIKTSQFEVNIFNRFEAFEALSDFSLDDEGKSPQPPSRKQHWRL